MPGRKIFTSLSHPCHRVKVDGAYLKGWFYANTERGVACCQVFDEEGLAVWDEDGHLKYAEYQGVVTVEPPGGGKR